MGSKYSRPKAQAPLEIKLLDFLYGEWGVERRSNNRSESRYGQTPSPSTGEGGTLNCAPSADAVAGNGPDGPAPTQSRQGRGGGEAWRGGKGQYVTGVLGQNTD